MRLFSRWLSAVSLIIFVILMFYPGLSGNFFFDDKSNIVDNAALKFFDGSFSSLFAASTNGIASPLGRPLSMASFALNLHFLGENPFYFKLVNLLIHLANGVMVFVLARQILQRLRGAGNSFPAAMWIAAIWLLHPINLSPVLFVVQRMTSLAAFFTLAALCLYLYGRLTEGRRSWSAFMVSLLVCWPMGILAKETALLLPLFILIIEWLVLEGVRSVPPRIIKTMALTMSLLLVGVLVIKWDMLASGYAFRGFGPVERMLTEARVLWFYLLQFFLPWPELFSLHHDDIPISRGLMTPPQTLLAIFAWIFIITLAIRQRRHAPMFAFAVAWFLAAHTIESTFLPLDIAYEHRNYLAFFGFLLWMATLFFPTQAQPKGRVPRLVLATGLFFFCSLITTLRADQWGDEFRRTQLEVMSHPDSARANNEAAVEFMGNTFLSTRGGSPFAYQSIRFYFKRAAEIDRNNKGALIGQLYLDCLAGAPKDKGLQAALRERFATTPFAPGDQGVVRSLSELLVENRLCLNDAEVQALLDAALANPEAKGKIRGLIYVVAMDYAIAHTHSLPLGLSYARAAVDSDPGNISLRINLLRILLASGNRTEALQQYQSLGRMHIAPTEKSDVEKIGVALKTEIGKK